MPVKTVSRPLALSLLCGLGVALQVSAAPPNDQCASSLGSPVPSSGGVITGTVTDATIDGAGCGFPLQPGADVYHSFVPATRGPWRLDLCSSAVEWDTVLSIHRHPSNPAEPACPTSASNRVAGGCDDDSCSPFVAQVPSRIRAVSLEPGVLYTIRIAGFDQFSVVDEYTLAVTDLGVANDACQDAAAAAIPGFGGMITGTLADATTDGTVDPASCLGSSRAGSARDVYHAFTPDTTGRWTFSTCIEGNGADTVVSIHTACPPTAANALICNNDGCETRPGSSVLSADLTAGVPYIIRIAEFQRDRFDSLLGDPQYVLSVTGEATGRCCSTKLGSCQVLPQSQCEDGDVFTLNGVCAPLGPGNAGACPVGTFNACAQAFPLTAEEIAVASTNGLTGTALAACTDTTADCWFTFTAPHAASYQILAVPNTFNPLFTSVYAGSACPAAPGTELDCGFAFVEGLKFTLNSGESIKIRCASSLPTLFAIRVAESFFPTPANDLCSQALPLTRDVPTSGTVTGSSGGLAQQVCSSGPHDVWYTYTPASTGVARVVITPASGSEMTTAVSVTTTCGGAFDTTVCAQDPSFPEQPTELIFPATSGTTYLLRVASFSQIGDFAILVSDAPAGPANDACANAPTLTLGTQQAGTTAFAMGSNGLIGFNTCSNANNPDVWFKFRASSAVTHEVTITPTSPAGPSIAIGVFEACPTAQATDYACAGAFVPGFPNTVRFLASANTDYFIRASTLQGESSDFTVIVEESATAIGACCVSEGGCYLDTSESCGWVAGTYIGDGVTCAAAPCELPGRCCFANSSHCIVTVAASCTGPGATFTSGATCDFTTCPTGTPPANDLCVNAPTLTLPAEVLTATDHADAEGPAIPAGFCGSPHSFDLGLDRSVYYRFVAPGAGAVHVDIRAIDFPQPMLVLYRGASCTQLLDVGCTVGFQRGERRTFPVENGQTYYLGIGILNDPDLFNEGGIFSFTLSFEGDSGFCCRGTTCVATDASNCTGTVAGSASLPLPSCGAGDTLATCCYADYNHDGAPSIDDLFLYLNAYFTSSPWANVGGDGIAAPTIDDLFLYINAYFTGCA